MHLKLIYVRKEQSEFQEERSSWQIAIIYLRICQISPEFPDTENTEENSAKCLTLSPERMKSSRCIIPN
jgi:hypothetical protein